MNAYHASQVGILVLTVVVGVVLSLYVARKMGRFLNFRTLLLLNYVAVLGVSGLTHLSNEEVTQVGFYDVRGLADLPTFNLAMIASLVGFVGLVTAVLRKIPRARSSLIKTQIYDIPPVERKILSTAVIILLPITIYATLVIQQYAATLDQERIISIDNGYARYSYLSSWIVWAISFLAIRLLGSSFGKSRLASSAVVVCCVLSIVAALAWNGGRSIILVMILPLMLVVMPRLQGIRWVLLPIALVAAVQYLSVLSLQRSGGSDGIDLVAWLDWQWGRFSMVGWAVDVVEGSGYLFGETFAYAYTNVIFGVARLIGLNLNNPDWSSSTSLTGQTLLGDPSLTYIVPGLTAELYLNFGILGVFIGMFLLGLTANWIDKRFIASPSVTMKLVYAYVGSLLVLRTLAADSGALPSYLIYTGLPLFLVAWCVSYLTRQSIDAKDRRRRRKLVPSKL